MQLPRRTVILLIVFVIVVIGAALYFNYSASTNPNSPSLPFFPTAADKNVTPAAPTQTVTNLTTTTTRKSSGYTVTVHGKTETITSAGAGVSLETPINTNVSQASAILSITPPQSKSGESLRIQKTEAGFNDPLSGVASALNGKQLAFEALRSTQDQNEYNPGNVVAPAHIRKVHNLTVGGVAAVEVHVTSSASGTASARDFYLIWVHSGITNWYIVRTSIGLTPDAQSALDTIVSSIQLLK